MTNINKLLVDLLDSAFNTIGWQGPYNLINTVENSNINQLTYTSPTCGYNIWQILLHCTYWKWVVVKILKGEKPEGFFRSPDDFPSPPEIKNKQTWAKDFSLFFEQHNSIKETVLEFPESKWNDIPELSENKISYIKRVYGLAAHDIYHTGQIRNMGIPDV